MKVFVSAIAIAAAQDLTGDLTERGFVDSFDGVEANDYFGGYDYNSILADVYENVYSQYGDSYGTVDSSYGAYDGTNFGDVDVGGFGDYSTDDYEAVDFNNVEAADAPVVIEAPPAAPVVAEKEKVRPGTAANAAADDGRGMAAGGSLGGGDGQGPFHYCQRLHGATFAEAISASAVAITDPNNWMDCDIQHQGTQANNQACLYTVREVGTELRVWSTCSTIAACRTQMAQNYNTNVPSLSQCRDNSHSTNPRFRKPSTCNFCSKLSQDADRHVPISAAPDKIDIAGAPKSFYDLAANGADTFGAPADVYWTTHEEETGADTLLGQVYAGQAYKK